MFLKPDLPSFQNPKNNSIIFKYDFCFFPITITYISTLSTLSSHTHVVLLDVVSKSLTKIRISLLFRSVAALFLVLSFLVMIHRRTLMQLRGSIRCFSSTGTASKVVNSAMEAVKDIPDDSTLSVGGFGVCGEYIISI